MAGSDPDNISLSPASRRFVQKQVEAGRFRTPDEVVAEAMRTLEERERFIEETRDEIRRKIEEGALAAERGELIDGKDVFAELDSLDEEEDQRDRRKRA